MPIEVSGKFVSNIRVMDNSAASSSAKSASVARQGAARPVADTVNLTDTAAYLRKLESTLSALPIVDIQRTEDIKKAIADGRFVIDPVRVADKLLRFESMLYHNAA